MAGINYNKTPWMDWMSDRVGWDEAHDDARLAAYWKYVHLDFKTVVGLTHAWCAMTVNAALIESGFKGNGSAAASSFATYGLPCEYSFGAILPIRHHDGSHHVTFFVRWVNENERIAVCFGGNQGNALCRKIYDLSGNALGRDEVVPSPRWPVAI